MSTMKEDSGKREGIRFSRRCGRLAVQVAFGGWHVTERFEFWAGPEPFYCDNLYWTVSTAVAGGLSAKISCRVNGRVRFEFF